MENNIAELHGDQGECWSKPKCRMAPPASDWLDRTASVLNGMAIGAILAPLGLAILGAIACALQRGIPMVSIPNPVEAAVSGFAFTLLLLGGPAVAVGAFLGGAVGILRPLGKTNGQAAKLAAGPLD